MRLAALTVSLLVACGGDKAAPADVLDAIPGDTATLGDTATGDVTVLPSAPGSRFSLRLAAGRVELRSDDAVRLAFDAFPVALGVVDAVDDDTNYDPYWLDPSAGPFAGDPPPGLVFRTPTAVTPVAGAASPTFDLAFDGGLAARLTLTAAGDGRFAVELTPTTGSERVAYLRLRLPVPPAERLYGGGNQHDRPTIDGKRLAMQLELDLDLETGYNERHAPIPLALSTAAWGLFVETAFPAVFDVGARSAPDRALEVTVGAGLRASDGLRCYLFVADHPLDLLARYYETTAYPRVPGRAGFGPWIWRDETPGQGDRARAATGDNPGVEDDLATIRALDLPTSGYWIDRPYASGVNSFDFDPAKYDDAPAMIDYARAEGFAVALWHTPYAASDAPAVRAAVIEGGFFPPETGLLLNGFGSAPIDLTNAAARAYWGAQIRRYTDLGVTGFKLDFAEDVVPGLPGARSNRWLFSDGSDERTMHDGYQRLYHATYSAELPPGDSFVLARTGRFGDQANVDCLWPGDLDADFARHREGGRVGGIPAALAYGVSVSASGYPFYAADTGGYRHGPPTREAYSRWFEMTSVSAVMQVGGNDNQVPWELDRFEDDPSVLADYRRYARLHMSLFAYAYTLAQELRESGRPLVRPVGLAFPEMPEEPESMYLFGDALLVAPVVTAGAVTREVVFPPGRWLGWWDGAAHEGGRTETVAAPIGTLPLFLREGEVVPMLRPDVDTLAPASDPHVDSFTNEVGRLWARAGAGSAGAATVFDGATVRVEVTDSGLVLRATAGAEFTAGAVVELIGFGGAPPTRVTVDGVGAPPVTEAALDEAAAGYVFDGAAAGGRLLVVVPFGARVAVDR